MGAETQVLPSRPSPQPDSVLTHTRIPASELEAGSAVGQCPGPSVSVLPGQAGTCARRQQPGYRQPDFVALPGCILKVWFLGPPRDPVSCNQAVLVSVAYNQEPNWIKKLEPDWMKSIDSQGNGVGMVCDWRVF